MRKYFALAWILFPVFVLFYHYNYGYKHIIRMDAGRAAKVIDQMAADKRWEEVITEYDKLKQLLPEDEPKATFTRIELGQLQAQIRSGGLAEGLAKLAELRKAVIETYGGNARLTRLVREISAEAHYNAAVILRWDKSEEAKKWKTHAHAARQQLRYLVENHGESELGRPDEKPLSGKIPAKDKARIVHLGHNVYSFDDRELYNLQAVLYCIYEEPTPPQNNIIIPPPPPPLPPPPPPPSARQKLKTIRRPGS